MKFYIDETLIFELSEIQKKVIGHFIEDEIFFEDIARRVKESIMCKYRAALHDMKKEFTDKLIAEGLSAITVNDDDFATLIMNHPEYENKSMRLLKEKIHDLQRFLVANEETLNKLPESQQHYAEMKQVCEINRQDLQAAIEKLNELKTKK